MTEPIPDGAPAVWPWPVTQCSTCKASIIFAKTAQGKDMPVDAEPSPNGNVRLRDTGMGQPLAVVYGTVKQFGATGLRTSHFATCPDAARHRRATTKKRSAS